MSVEEESVFYGKLEERASAYLGELGKMLDEKQIQWNGEIAYGPRAKTILDEAEKLHTDLIVIRSHRVGDEKPSEMTRSLSTKKTTRGQRFAWTPIRKSTPRR